MEVLYAEHDPRNQRFIVVKELESGLCHCSIPEDTLEWRAAEYQIEPTEIDLLMDIVLYEGGMPQEEPVPVLFTAATVDEAREIHIGRILAYKKKIRPVANAWKNREQRIERLRQAGAGSELLDLITDGDALIPIREKHLMDREVLVEKALVVQGLRQRAKERERGPAFVTPSERAARIRAARFSSKKERD